MGQIIDFENVYLEYPDDVEISEETELNREDYKQVVSGRKAFSDIPEEADEPLQK